MRAAQRRSTGVGPQSCGVVRDRRDGPRDPLASRRSGELGLRAVTYRLVFRTRGVCHLAVPRPRVRDSGRRDRDASLWVPSERVRATRTGPARNLGQREGSALSYPRRSVLGAILVAVSFLPMVLGYEIATQVWSGLPLAPCISNPVLGKRAHRCEHRRPSRGTCSSPSPVCARRVGRT